MKRFRPYLWTLALVGLVIALLVGSVMGDRRRERQRRDREVVEKACVELLEGSDILTAHIRRFVETDGGVVERDAYFREAEGDRHREEALKTASSVASRYPRAVQCLHEAMESSLALMNREYHAMRLLTPDDRITHAPPEVREFRLTAEERCVTAQERRRRAREEIFGEAYASSKAAIRQLIADAREALREERE